MQKRIGICSEKLFCLLELKLHLLAKDFGKEGNNLKKKLSKWIEPRLEEEFQIEFEKFQKELQNSKDLDQESARKLEEYLEFYNKKREKIAKCYTSRDFSAGASSTQRSESLNAIVKKYIQMARRISFSKLIGCIKEISEGEEYHTIKSQRIASMKYVISKNSLHQSILVQDCFSPFVISKILKQYQE
jgi:hypothetical protein